MHLQEESVARALAPFQTLLERVADSVMIVSREGGVPAMSPGARRLHGQASSAGPGKGAELRVTLPCLGAQPAVVGWSSGRPPHAPAD